MRKTIISDASCFIILEKIGQFELLQKTYVEVVTTSDVAAEYGPSLPVWVKIIEPENTDRVKEFSSRLGKGESSTIALALELDDCSLILDDQKARKLAERLGIHVTGTIGVIVRAKLRGVIPSIKPFLERMRQTNFRFSDEVESSALHEAGEGEE